MYIHKQFIENVIVTIWLLIVLYDSINGLPPYLHIPVVIFWFITILAVVKWGVNASNNLYIKSATILISSFVIFVAFGQAIDILVFIPHRSDNLYVTVTLLLVQSSIASIFSAFVVAIPLVSVYSKNLIGVILLACSPIIAFQVFSVVTTDKLVTQLIMSFEILFRVIAIWFVCVLANKALTSSLSGRKIHAA